MIGARRFAVRYELERFKAALADRPPPPPPAGDIPLEFVPIGRAAKELGCSRRQVSRYIRDKAEPAAEAIRRPPARSAQAAEAKRVDDVFLEYQHAKQAQAAR
jgi:hypothetical protein